jgi:RNA polymerase sigma-70 factor (ECF subfamily)
MADRHADFVALLEPERDALWRFAHRMCWDRSSAEDCLQEATLIAYRKFDVFTPGTSFRAWTFRILSNVILNANSQTRRALQVRAATEEIDLMAALDREEAYEKVLDDPDQVLQQVSDPVRRAVKGLPPHERMVFLLRAVEGFSYREIADFLSIPMGTVMSHLFRARTRLRELLTDYVRESGFARVTS